MVTLIGPPLWKLWILCCNCSRVGPLKKRLIDAINEENIGGIKEIFSLTSTMYTVQFTSVQATSLLYERDRQKLRVVLLPPSDQTKVLLKFKKKAIHPKQGGNILKLGEESLAS